MHRQAELPIPFRHYYLFPLHWFLSQPSDRVSDSLSLSLGTRFFLSMRKKSQTRHRRAPRFSYTSDPQPPQSSLVRGSFFDPDVSPPFHLEFWKVGHLSVNPSVNLPVGHDKSNRWRNWLPRFVSSTPLLSCIRSAARKVVCLLEAWDLESKSYPRTTYSYRQRSPTKQTTMHAPVEL